MFKFSAIRRIALASVGAVALMASTSASAALMTFSSEAAFLSALGGSTDFAMRFEGVAAPGTHTNQASTSGSHAPHTEDGITIDGLLHIISASFGATDPYDIGTGDSAQTRPDESSNVTHADGDMFAFGVTFYTVQNNANHASTTVDFFLDGAASPVASIVTPAPQGSSVFFGVTSDIPFSSVRMFANRANGARRFLQTDNILVNTAPPVTTPPVTPPAQPVSEPGIAALALLGFIGIGLGRRQVA